MMTNPQDPVPAHFRRELAANCQNVGARFCSASLSDLPAVVRVASRSSDEPLHACYTTHHSPLTFDRTFVCFSWLNS